MAQDLPVSPQVLAGDALPTRSRRWNSGAWLGAVAAILVGTLVYLQTWIESWPQWRLETYTHFYLVPFIAAWLVWNARKELADRPIVPVPAALLLVLLLSAAWLVAARGNILLVHLLLWPLVVLSMVWAGAGTAAARAMAFPLCFTYFVVPFWDLLKPGLQALASVAVGSAANIVGMQVVVEGSYLMLPRATVEIALECSGANFLCVSLMLGALAGQLRGDRWPMRLLIMAVAGVIGILANWVRIFLLVLVYMYPSFQEFHDTIGHMTFSYLVLAPGLAFLLFVLGRVPAPEARRGTSVATATNPRGLGGLLSAIAAGMLLPAISWALSANKDAPPAPESPPQVADFSGPRAPDPRWQPPYHGAAWEHRAAYFTPGGQAVELYRNEYHGQKQGSELIVGDAEIFDPLEFSTRSRKVRTVRVLGAAPMDVIDTEFESVTQRRWRALYAYTVDGRMIASARKTQLITSLKATIGQPAAGVLAVAAPCVPDCEAVMPAVESLFVAAVDAYVVSGVAQ